MSRSEIQPAVALDLLRSMYLVRRFEERVGDLFAAGEVPGFVHLSIGQEAVAAGICSVLQVHDYLTTTHRGHGHVLAKGADPARMLAELLGRGAGYCKGKGGSMHVMAMEVGVLGANGIVGAGIPIAAGAALTAKRMGRGQAAVAFFGDGAVGAGAFHEAINLAAVLQLPLVLVCENNHYAEMTPYAIHSRAASVSERAAGYGIPGCTVDGNDVLAVRAAAFEAVERARLGHGPTLIEADTYRWRGHYEGDKQAYRSKEEVADWQTRDPLSKFQAFVLAEGLADASTVARLRDEVESQLEAAVVWALACPAPEEATLLEDVYA
jgi:acetoin:2,6-dichlorophenolindophenol oxidoreductase subunit alpha